jgi:raffinose/stachyose/melibiose transport system substrate-binding protein
MKMKKLLSILLVATMVVTMMAGCGKSTTTESSNEVKTDEVKVINMIFWDDLNTTQDLVSLQYKKIIEEFNAANNGYKIEVTYAALSNQVYDTTLNAAIAAGKTPDIFFADPGPKMTKFVESGVSMDLTDVFAKEADWKASFKEGIFGSLTYDDKIMAVPLNFATACVFYNKTIFEEVGVTPPTNWAEFMDISAKIKAAGYAPITCSGVDAWCVGILGGYLCDREGGPDNLAGVIDGSGSWTDDSYIRAGKKLEELAANGYFQTTFLGDSNDQSTANFYNNQAAMLVQGSWAIGQINGNNPESEATTGVFTFPKLEDGTGDANRWVCKTDNICIGKDSKVVDGIVLFLKMLTSDASQKEIAETAGKVPVIKGIDIDYDKAPMEFKPIVDAMESMTGTLGFYNESVPSSQIGDEFNSAVLAIASGQKTSEQAFKDLQAFQDAQ